MKIGTNLAFGCINGKIISFDKSGDICILWDTGEQSTYGKKFVEDHCLIKD